MPDLSREELRATGRLDWWWAGACQILLCAKQAEKGIALAAADGECPAHGGDACLFVFAAVRDVEHVADALDAAEQRAEKAERERDVARDREHRQNLARMKAEAEAERTRL